MPRKVEIKKVSLGISLDGPIYEAVQALAAADQQSVAFIIREAVEQYLLLRQGDGTVGGRLLEAATQPGAKPIMEIARPATLRSTLIDILRNAKTRLEMAEIPEATNLVPAKEPARGRGRKRS